MSTHDKDVVPLLEEMKEWLTKHENYPEIPDDILVMFLRCRNNDTTLAQETIEHYLEITSTTPELFCNCDPLNPTLQDMIPILNFFVLPERDKDGNVVMIFTFNDEDVTNFNHAEFSKLLLMYFFITAYEYGDVPGYIILTDTGNLRLSYVADVKISVIRKFVNFLQDALPMNINSFHVINTGFVMKMMFNLAKPFMYNKLAKKVVLHSSNLEDLHKIVPNVSLPEEFGGLNESMKILKKSAEKNLLEKRKLLLEAAKVRLKDTQHSS